MFFFNNKSVNTWNWNGSKILGISVWFTYEFFLSWSSRVSDLGLPIKQHDDAAGGLDAFLEVRSEGECLRSR